MAHGALLMMMRPIHFTPLVKFAIFQSEGGQVPDGATIQSATLALYKYSSYDFVYRAHRLLQGVE